MQGLELTKDLENCLEKLKGLSEQKSSFREYTQILAEMEELLHRYEEEYIDFRLICDHLEMTIFVTDDKGDILYVNPSYLKKTGLKREELIGSNAIRLNYENKMQCEVIPEVLQKKKPMSGIGYVISTDYRGFISGIPVKEGEKIRYVVTTDWDTYTIMELENFLKGLKQGKNLSGNAEAEPEEDDDDTVLYVSDQMRKVITVARTVAKTDATVLITGETGTGKEVLSNVIVRSSRRADKPFIKVNCAAIPEELLESELFGYEEGAFTGAKKGGKKGAFEEAEEGTILLDEIGELPFQVQAKLLRVLQENEITRIGGQKTIPLDIRIIAATNRNLRHEIREGRFREDLYYRLNILPLEIPPLRERPEDIPFLAGHFLEEFNRKYGRETIMDPDVMRIFRGYSWPGNVRELRNLAERLVVLSVDGRITKEEVQRILEIRDDVPESKGQTLKEAVAQLEALMIRNALDEYGSKNRAAAALGIDHSTLIRKCRKYQLD